MEAMWEAVDAANEKIPELVEYLEYWGHTVTETTAGDLVVDPSVTVGEYWIDICLDGAYMLGHHEIDGIQYWPPRQRTAEILADLDQVIWGNKRQCIITAVEALRDLVGGETMIEYEWLDAAGNPCRLTTTIDEHLEELRDCIDPEYCDLVPVEVSREGVWCLRYKCWQYAVVVNSEAGAKLADGDEVYAAISAYDPETEEIEILRDLINNAGGIRTLDDTGGEYLGGIMKSPPKKYEDYIFGTGAWSERFEATVWAIDFRGMALVGYDEVFVAHVSEL